LRLGLARAWRRAAEDQSMVLRDAVEHRSRQETWEPISSLPSAEQETYLNELAEMGLISKRSDLLGLPLTVSTCQLIRSLYHFVQSGQRLDCYELEPVLCRCVAQILRVQFEYYIRALANPTLSPKRSTILVNVEFLTEQALPKLAKHLNLMEYREVRGLCEELRAAVA
uniref:SEC63 domain-containing protein n=1 Tax=Echinostoma caproni TaxID=27848 RepID=A0A183B9C8_9TREM